MNNGYTEEIIAAMKTGRTASLVRESIRAGVDASSSKEEAASCLMTATIASMAPFIEGIPTVLCAILIRALTTDVDWSAVLDAVCVDAECN